MDKCLVSLSSITSQFRSFIRWIASIFFLLRDSENDLLVLWLLRYVIGLKDSRHFFIQSEVKPKPIVTRSDAFCRALRQLHVITSSFDWFTVLSVFFVIMIYDTQMKTTLSPFACLFDNTVKRLFMVWLLW